VKPGVVGKYPRRDRPGDYFELKSDGTFHVKQGGREISGTYEIAAGGNALIITTRSGSSETEQFLKDGSILDADGILWEKKH
jgi:hypothetical protein